MTSYDEQYQAETSLFGAPYAEFEAFVSENALEGGSALDLGCGQGRDALMLAKHGYEVIGVDSSAVGIAQMVASAEARSLPVQGVVADIFDYEPPQRFDAIVLDSILHFGKADREGEIALLNRMAAYVKPNGFLFLFVHRSRPKERILKGWFDEASADFSIAKEGYIAYTYEERTTGFQSQFDYYMLILRREAEA